MKNIILICTFVFVAFFTSSHFVFSQSLNSEGKNADVIAQVSIGNAKLNHFDRNSIITFSIENYGPAVSGIRTSIILLSSDLSSVLDQNIIDESVSLASGENKSVVYSYSIPDSLSGVYRIGIKAQTGSGLSLGTLIFPEDVSTKSSSGGIYVDQKSCFMTVSGEVANKKYLLEEGVDVLPSEKLTLHCVVKNLDKVATDSKVVSNTYLRTLAGKVISGPVFGGSVKFGSLESKKIDIAIVLPEEPQAYDTFVRFENTNGQASNEIRAHFVVRGESATVQSVSLDKVSYDRGDVASLVLNWTPSADSFPDSRLGKGTAIVEPKAIVSLFSGNKVCAKEVSIPLDAEVFKVTSSINIDKDCVGVVAKVKIVSGDKELYSSDYNIPSTEKKNSINYWLVVVLSLVVVVGSVLIVKNRKARPLVVLLFLLSLSFLNFNEVNADTVTWKDKGNNTLSGTINMVRDWNVGDDVNFSGDFSTTYQWCSNGAKKIITLGYQLFNESGGRVSFKEKLSGPYINQSLGKLAAGKYVLKTYFGDSEEYLVSGYTDSFCPVMVDEYIELDEWPWYEAIQVPSGDVYACQLPTYILGNISGLASLEIPFQVNSGSNPPVGNLTCNGDTDTYSWITSMGVCGSNYTPKVPSVQCGMSSYLVCAEAPINVNCKRNSDNQPVADSLCNPATKPSITDPQTCSCKCGY